MSAQKQLDLQEKYEISVQEAAEIQAEVNAVEIELKALNERLIGANKDEREDLIRQRMELVGRIDSLKVILFRLYFLRDVASLARFEFKETQKAQETKEAIIKNREINVRLSQAKDELQKLNNGRSRDMTQKERDAKFIKLQMDVAQLSAELHISFRDLNRAKAALEYAQSETVRVRKELNFQA